MDAHLKTLADCGIELDAAEEALGDGAFVGARESLDRAAAGLADLRTAWPTLSPVERKVVGPAAKSLRDRLDAAAKRVPKLVALSDGAPEHDPEEEAEPEAA